MTTTDPLMGLSTLAALLTLYVIADIARRIARHWSTR